MLRAGSKRRAGGVDLAARSAAQDARNADRVAKRKAAPPAIKHKAVGVKKPKNHGNIKGKSHKSKGILKTKARMNYIVLKKQGATLKLTGFLDAALASLDEAVFTYLRRGTPLAAKSEKARGDIHEQLQRLWLKNHGIPTQDPKDTSYDYGILASEASRALFGLDKDKFPDEAVIKVESKSARMHFDKSHAYWALYYAKVKPECHDVVLLSFEAFDGVHLYHWKGGRLNSRGENADKGFCIKYQSKRNVPDPDAAQATLLKELAKNTVLGTIAYDDPVYKDVFAITKRSEDDYATTPFACLSSSARGDALEHVMFAALAHCQGWTLTEPAAGVCTNGRSTGKTSAPCDRMRGNVRLEGKASLLVYNKDHRCYGADWMDIHPERHDELYFAILTPSYISVHKRSDKLELQGTGAVKKKIIYAPPRHTVQNAATAILKKLQDDQCEYLCKIEFGPEDFARFWELACGDKAALPKRKNVQGLHAYFQSVSSAPGSSADHAASV